MGPSQTELKEVDQRGFWALIVTQFQGAFSDNTLQWLTTYLITQTVVDAQQRDHLMTVVMLLFTLPFIVFSMAGGHLADRYSKREVVLGVKIFEVFVMLLAFLSLANDHLYWTIFCVFLMGIHSAIFGPSKYGLLPELLPEKRLSWGNGILEFGTFIAIIGGTVGGGILCTTFAGHQGWSGLIFLGLAMVGLITGWQITRVPAAHTIKPFRINFVAELWSQMQAMRRDRPLWLALIGYTYFFGIAALLRLVIVIYAKDVMGISDPVETSYFQAATAIGIGLGCFLAGFLSEGKIETGLLPLGSFGLVICAAILGLRGISYHGVEIDLAALGFCGGFYVVPISAMLQHRPARDEKGAVLATASLVSWIGIGISAEMFSLLTTVLKLTPPEIFVVIAALTLTASLYLFWLMPEAITRCGLWLLTNSFYRLRIIGRDNLPAKGGVVLVMAPMTWAELRFLRASTDRPIRFLVKGTSSETERLISRAVRNAAIWVPNEATPEAMKIVGDEVRAAVRNGDVVGLVTEGIFWQQGKLVGFKQVWNELREGHEGKFVPVMVTGGKTQSGQRGGLVDWFWSATSKRQVVTINFGSELNLQAGSGDVRTALAELAVAAWVFRRKDMRPLPGNFVKQARRRPGVFCMADVLSGEVNFGQALIKTVFLSRRLRKFWASQQMVGIFLPPSVAGTLVNQAALLSGKVPVNLNYTLSEKTLASCIQRAGLKTIITSRAFLEKVKLNPKAELFYLEELAAKPKLTEKLTALLTAKLLPVQWLRRWAGAATVPDLDDPATLIFSSGSTGEPKGVELTHYNICANMFQMEQVLNLSSGDRFLGVLPFFHSFGFTVTLNLPMAAGCGVVFHPNPLDGKMIGKLTREKKVTILLGTPSFLQLYQRIVEPEDFAGLQHVIAGAEPLSARLALAFKDRFGKEPQQGYGTTECGPAVAVNLINLGEERLGSIAGPPEKIGRPMAGMRVRITKAENPWSEDELPYGESGMLMLQGPNVMRGYFRDPEKTQEVLRSGWYCTGDMASLDEEGFLEITGRLSRFSKIGGEMVPHIKIEDKLHELGGLTELTFVVAGVPDERKGERLIVLHRCEETMLTRVLEKFTACELPNLWKPKPDDFYCVESFPLLGSGKLDLRALRERAMSLVATAS